MNGTENNGWQEQLRVQLEIEQIRSATSLLVVVVAHADAVCGVTLLKTFDDAAKFLTKQFHEVANNGAT